VVESNRLLRVWLKVMNALFVAIKIPDPIGKALQTIQPAAGSRVRVVPKDRFHLTLCYIGRQRFSGIEQALTNIIARPFELCLTGTGHFGSARRGATLWAGIEENAELMSLQSKVEAALVSVGFEPETRCFKPHVTLARCKPKPPVDVLHEHAAKQFRHCFVVSKFGLYTSQPAPHGPPIYSLEHAYSLTE